MRYFPDSQGHRESVENNSSISDTDAMHDLVIQVGALNANDFESTLEDQLRIDLLAPSHACSNGLNLGAGMLLA
jgi:hypothetical protein